MSSTIGTLFRVTTWGESHGPAVGAVVDGCPPRIPISVEEIEADLSRRRPGQSRLVSQRQERDSVEILSGVLEGLSLGTPISIMVRNTDARSSDYEEVRTKYRPSHADFAYDQKYGIRAWAGGGRASARETVGRVAAGAIAKAVLRTMNVEIVGWVERIHDLSAGDVSPETVTREEVDRSLVRCPDRQASDEMVARIEAVRKAGDSVGGLIGCVARGVPAGWGEPVFDKLEADLAKAVLSIPACKGFESGDAFLAAETKGSRNNDQFYADEARRVFTATNHSGGIQGGISNGMPIWIKASFKPTATVLIEQHTVSTNLENTTIKGRGRHDPCVVPRAVPIVEAMMAIVLLDHALRQRAVTFP